MRFPWFPLLQSINASCNYKNKTCNYSLLYSLNKFPSYAKEVCIGGERTFLYVLEGKDKEV